jgi:hypothetical protein
MCIIKYFDDQFIFDVKNLYYMNKICLIKILILMITLNSDPVNAQDGDGRVSVWIYDISEAQADIDMYTNPKDRTYLVRPVFEGWLRVAFYKKEREEWANTTKMNAEDKKKINTALDALASSASKKLPAFVPTNDMFAFGTEAEKELLKSVITGDKSNLKYHNVGLQDKTWRIEKDSYDVPTGRRKWGHIWFRNTSLTENPWCVVFEVYLYQAYQGGGDYGETVAHFERRWISGCPK